MPWHLIRLFKNAGILCDEAASDDGSGKSVGGSAGASEDASDAASAANSKTADDKAEDSSKATKVSDAEAKLIKEVMEKKAKNKELADQLAQVNARLKSFEGIDVEQVRKMLSDQQNEQQRKLEEAGQWDALKKQMNEAFEKERGTFKTSVTDLQGKTEALQEKIAELTVGSAFGQSKFISEDMALTPAKTRIVYGSHFEFDGESVVAYNKPVGAKDRTMLVDGKGDPLGFDEALRRIVDADPDRDQLLKSKGKSGAGSRSESKGPAPKVDREVSSRDKIKAGLSRLGKP